MALLSLPLAAARAAVRLATFPARATVRIAVVLVEDLADMLQREPVDLPDVPGTATAPARPADPGLPEPSAPEPRPGAPRRTARSRPAARPRAAGSDQDLASPERGTGQQPTNGVAPAPAHIDAEVELVAESADPGAADGAGASLRIDPPWPRYSRMSAGAIVDRLVAEPDAALSVLLLYERAHRGRRSVIEAAERELQRRTGSSRSR